MNYELIAPRLNKILVIRYDKRRHKATKSDTLFEYIDI